MVATATGFLNSQTIPGFFMANVKFPRQTELTILQISPPLIAIPSTQLFTLSAS